MSTYGVQVLADLAEVERPDADSCGAAFLVAVSKEADVTWRAEAALTAIALRLAAALVAEALSARCEFAV